MMQMLEMLMQQKIQQIPQGMMNQLAQQLKRVNPQAYQEYQQARKSNADPNEYLNKVINGFNPEQKSQWDSMFGKINKQG